MQFGAANQHMVYPDGSVEWCSNFRAQTAAMLRLTLDKSQTAEIVSEDRRREDDECRLLEAFVADLGRTGVDVEIVLLPPNPWVFDAAEKERKLAGKTLLSIDTEAYIRSLAAKYKIRVLGSLNPHVLGVHEEDYVDDVHLRRDSIDRLFKRWKAVNP